MSLFSLRGLKALFRSTLSQTREFEYVAYLHAQRTLFRIRLNIAIHAQDASRLLQKRAIKIFVGGDSAFSHIEQLRYQARDTAIVQMFIWKDDTTGRRMASVLLDIANRGVKVIVRKDAVGDFFEYDHDFLGTRHSKETFWKHFWHHSHITIEHEKRNNHAKVYVIDGHTLLITGMNIADEYRYAWHDYLVELQGTHFAESFLTENPTLCPEDAKIIMNTATNKPMREVFMTLIQKAQESIVLEHAYFCDMDTVDLLAKRCNEGVRVTIIIPGNADFQHHGNMIAVGQLLTQTLGKAQVFLYPGMFHGKLLLVDHKTLFIGSTNILPSSLDSMGEVNVLLRGKFTSVLRKVRETLRSNILKSTSLSSPPQFWWVGRLLAFLRL